MSGSAAGPWLLVVGMHRSGTSAVTGAIGALGFNLVKDEDRLSPHESNPEHWESLSILLHNDAILEHFGGTWDAPPRLPRGWEDDSGLPDRMAAARLLAAAYPDAGPSVWKDPRVCLLLPYWLDVLDAPAAAVFVWRAPLAVARSLRRRNGYPVPYGVALWERYNRSALTDLARSDVYILDYDAMIEDPSVSLSSLAEWLSSIGTFDSMPAWDVDRALSAVSTTLRHESAQEEDDDDRILLEEQRRLVAHLKDMAGGHRSLPPPPGGESPWTSAILDASRDAGVLQIRRLQRELQHCEAEREWFVSELEESRSHLAGLKASSSWRITAPLRSITAWTSARRPRTVTQVESVGEESDREG